MKPIKSEAFASEKEAQARLGQVKAIYKPEVSTSAKFVYWSSSQGWITVERKSGRIVVSYYKECPCSG